MALLKLLPSVKRIMRTRGIRIAISLAGVALAGCVGTSGEPATPASEPATSQVRRPTETTTTTVESTNSTLAAQATWPAQPSILGYVTAVDRGTEFSVEAQSEGILIGPATITLDSGATFELMSETGTSKPYDLLGSEIASETHPCLLLMNVAGSTISQLHVLHFERLADDSEPKPVLNGPIYEIRGGLALVETPYGVFTVPIAEEVNTTECGGHSIRELVQQENYWLYLNVAAEIDAVVCYAYA